MTPDNLNLEKIIPFLSANNVVMQIGLRPFQRTKRANHTKSSSINVASARPFKRFSDLKFDVVGHIVDTDKSIGFHV